MMDPGADAAWMLACHCLQHELWMKHRLVSDAEQMVASMNEELDELLAKASVREAQERELRTTCAELWEALQAARSREDELTKANVHLQMQSGEWKAQCEQQEAERLAASARVEAELEAREEVWRQRCSDLEASLEAAALREKCLEEELLEKWQESLEAAARLEDERERAWKAELARAEAARAELRARLKVVESDLVGMRAREGKLVQEVLHWQGTVKVVRGRLQARDKDLQAKEAELSRVRSEFAKFVASKRETIERLYGYWVRRGEKLMAVERENLRLREDLGDLTRVPSPDPSASGDDSDNDEDEAMGE